MLTLFTSVILFLLSFSTSVFALEEIPITGSENGTSMGDAFLIWHDTDGKATFQEAVARRDAGLFKPIDTKGSTGLKTGATWSYFLLKNVTDRPQTIHLEYVDHQLIALDAYQKRRVNDLVYHPIANLDLNLPFSHRLIPHNRFVVPVTIEPGETSEIYIRFGSDHAGFVFPQMRIWEPKNLRRTQLNQIALIAFFFGGFFLMSVFSFVGGVASKEKAYTIYSVYALSKIWAWSTILGYTHQFLVTENFHWSYMSLSGAVTIFCGLLFARTFLQTREYLRKLDYVLLFMMANAVFLFFSALFKQTQLAVTSITLALLLYPVLSVAGLIRWYQGSREGAIFSLAWSFLVAGLFVQALRDLGFVEHNTLNYYWPPLASFTEMAVILLAMGMRFRRLRTEKELAEKRYTQQLEQSKEELEVLVQERTRDLENQKALAELEARTDALTGLSNRRDFYSRAADCLDRARMRHRPYSVLLFDIDKFKAINDHFGHAIGDEALRAFALEVEKLIRGEDIFGRLGGEEFALLIQQDPEHTLQAAERLRKAVESITLPSPKGSLSFTTSIGISHFNGKESVEELLNRADKALYRAKSAGRNQVSVAA